jgi:ribonuclease R
VTSFGMFVAIDDIFIEGLVHVSELGQDYFHYDQAKHMMLGERTGKKYRLGDRVRIKVMRADIETSKIDFSLIEQVASPEEFAMPKKKPARSGGRKK